jgi:hypothetical protein
MRTFQHMTSRVIDGGTPAQREALAEALSQAAMADALCLMASPDMRPVIHRGQDDRLVLTFLAHDGTDTEDFPEDAPAYCAVLKMAEAFGVIVED